ncbi:MAG: hypothetical protein WC087_00500 [Candidatus Paceibacterota bacterium]
MKELTETDVLKMLPRLSAIKFTLEKSSRSMRISPYEMLLQQDGWGFVGWTFSSDVDIRVDCPYVCMFETEDGIQSWCHAIFTNLEMIAYKLLDTQEVVEPQS